VSTPKHIFDTLLHPKESQLVTTRHTSSTINIPKATHQASMSPG